jgi:DNA-binding transcriptional LysR family regulator
VLDRVTLDQLRVLVAVAETGSFSAAARRLGRVQSAISQAVQALETGLGTPLFDRDTKVPKLNDAGRVILTDARRVIGGVDALKARAESIAADVEPELTLAVDAIFPLEVLTVSLKALAELFPALPVTLFTEGLGGAEQRLRDGVARIALCLPLPSLIRDFQSEFLIVIPTVAVVAAGHPLAAEKGPLTRTVMQDQVQLVLTDRTPITAGIGGSILSFRTWRFADLATRLDFLLAGLGWCNMPVHMVREHIAAGRLNVLHISDARPPDLNLHIAHAWDRPPGRAGRWLIEDLRKRLVACVEPMSIKDAAE